MSRHIGCITETPPHHTFGHTLEKETFSVPKFRTTQDHLLLHLDRVGTSLSLSLSPAAVCYVAESACARQATGLSGVSKFAIEAASCLSLVPACLARCLLMPCSVRLIFVYITVALCDAALWCVEHVVRCCESDYSAACGAVCGADPGYSEERGLDIWLWFM